MAVIPSTLVPRAYYCNASGYCYYSTWHSWQRWVVLGAVLIFVFFLFLFCSCFSARRRRRRGLSPFYGTAWAAPPPAYDAHQHTATGPQYGGQTYPPPGPQGFASPPVYAPPGAGYFANGAGPAPPPPPHPNYEMGPYGGPPPPPNQPFLPYQPQMSPPPPAHISKPT